MATHCKVFTHGECGQRMMRMSTFAAARSDKTAIRPFATLLPCSKAAPAWSGYCTAADRDSLESFVRRCKRLGYCDVDTQSVVEQFQLADETLFERVLNDDRHVLHSLQPPRTECSYNFRRRRHDYELIPKTRTLNISKFIIRIYVVQKHWHTFISYLMNKYVSGDWPISIHADPISCDMLQRCAWPARWPIRPIFGFCWSKVYKNGRFPALDADEPPCKIWRR